MILLQGEKNEQCLYSDSWADQSKWEPQDYYAWFLWNVCDSNTTHFDELFYGKGLSDIKMDIHVWNLLQRCTYDWVSSRKDGLKSAALINNKKQHIENVQALVQSASERLSVSWPHTSVGSDNDSDLIELLKLPSIFQHWVSQHVQPLLVQSSPVQSVVIKVESESSNAERQHHSSLQAPAPWSSMQWSPFSRSVIKEESETEKIAQQIDSISNAD